MGGIVNCNYVTLLIIPSPQCCLLNTEKKPCVSITKKIKKLGNTHQYGQKN